MLHWRLRGEQDVALLNIDEVPVDRLIDISEAIKAESVLAGLTIGDQTVAKILIQKKARRMGGRDDFAPGAASRQGAGHPLPSQDFDAELSHPGADK
jgi:hypothetical protein